KIPVTIRSRCQQFDFRRGTVEAISSRIAYVAQCENVSLTPEATLMIARAAQGSYRDSLSILEQIISFSGSNITEKEVTGVLGLIEEDILFEISAAVRGRDMTKAFLYADRLLAAGKDIKDAIPSAAAFFRDLLAVKIGADKTRSERWNAEAAAFDAHELVRAIDIFLQSERSLRYTQDARLVFELAFMKACSPEAPAPEAVRQAPEKPRPREEAPAKKEPVRILQTGRPKEEPRKPAAAPVIDLNNIRKFWKKYLEYVRQNYGKVQLAKSAARAHLNEYSDGTLYISFDHTDEFVCNMCNEEKKVLEEALANCYKSHIRMVFETEPAPAPEETRQETEPVAPPTPEGLEEANKAEPGERDAYSDNPRIAEPEPSPLADPRYDDHSKMDEILDLFPGSDVENIDK
ncbi:MAG: hypothetical protein IJT95_07135, partial [Abditibacteriota bacterium]|nr:hypothetical protein [Abditibacteriota bacterium]